MSAAAMSHPDARAQAMGAQALGSQTQTKVDPETLTLRAAPRPVMRLNRRMLIALAVALGLAVTGATLWSLQPHHHDRNPAAELFNVDRVARADNLDQLPKDYSQLPPVPVAPKPNIPTLGEPLPGNLGPAIVHAQQTPGDGAGTSLNAGAAQSDRLDRARDAEEAARSSVFFRSSGGVSAQPSMNSGAQIADGRSSDQSFNPIASSSKPTLYAQAAGDSTVQQNLQDQKTAFTLNPGDAATRNPGSLQAPASPYTVMAGTIIPAALVTGINSDLPGQVIAIVTEAVYDTGTGRYLLIPQGSRLIGRYDSQVSFGQRRVLLVWTRLILPDTSSIALDRLPGIDPAGYAGLEDGVDWHWDQILSGAALSTLLGVGAELAAPSNSPTGSNGNEVVLAVRSSAQDTVNQVGQEITKRNMDIQPTLTIRPGFAMRVMVNKDLILRPYQPLFFQRGSSQ